MHLHGNLEEVFQKSWGDRAFFNSHTSNSRGIAVLLNDDFTADNISFDNIHLGNLSRLSCSLKFLVKGIYAPNEDIPNAQSKQLFDEMFYDS